MRLEGGNFRTFAQKHPNWLTPSIEASYRRAEKWEILNNLLGPHSSTSPSGIPIMDRTAQLLELSSDIPHHPSGGTLLSLSRPKAREGLTHRLTRWLTLLTLTAAPAYLMGRSYHVAWFRTLGVLPSDFSRDAAQYIYEGLFAFSSVVRHAFDLLIRPDILLHVGLEIVGLLLLFLLAYRTTEFVNRRFRARVHSFRVWLTRKRRKVLKSYMPETTVGLAALFTVIVPWLFLVAVFFIVLIPYTASRAGRTDALRFWHDLEIPKVQDTFPTVELPDAHGAAVKMHVIDSGTSSYMLYDGQRFIVVRKELLPRQIGPEPPWKP